jgi:hypothetical protein
VCYGNVQLHLNEVGKDKRKKWREDEEEGVSSYWMMLGKEMLLDIEKGRNRSQSVENSLWKRQTT